MNFLIILPAIILLALILPSVHAYTPVSYDLEKIELQLVDYQVLSMDDTPGYYLDNSDLVKITINVTNIDLDYFVLNDEMFMLWAMEPDIRKSTPDLEVLELVDNYYTSYNDGLAVKYDNFQSRELFEECEWINKRMRIDVSYVFTVCFDILRIWNNEILNLDGHKQYYLVMMDNKDATSCPDCKKILLGQTQKTYQQYDVPDWAQTIFDWHQRGIISDREFENSIAYLLQLGVISEKTEDQTEQLSLLEEKNRELKEHQERLSLAQQTNLYVSAMNFYETDYSENFSGVLCKKQNNIVTLSGDYTNEKEFYDTIFFKLLVFDERNNVVAVGISKIIDVVPKEFSHFEVSTPYHGKINNCFVMVDSNFQSQQYD